MRLADMAGISELDLKRDGTFESLGFLHHRTERMLAWIESPRYLPMLTQAEHVSAVIAHPDLAGRIPPQLGLALHPSPRAAFYRIHNFLAQQTEFYGKPFESEIAAKASVHPKAFVEAKNVRIAEGARVEAGAVVLAGSILKEGAIVHAGAVIGAQGFEFVRLGNGILTVFHAGGVLLDEGVEIQSNSTVARGLFRESTIVGADTKADAHVHIAHNCVIGKRCLLAAHVTLSGSVTIGDEVWIGPGATISNGLQIGSRSRITIGSVVVTSVPEAGHVTGNWAIPHHRFVLAYARTLASPPKKQVK